MALSQGTRLGPYEIVARIGAGGMGEVFKARDTRLDRSVAVKILPNEFAANAQLKVRFEREAKTISQLNHPHICTLYDVGEADTHSYLVMELLEGESLADRVARGPLPLDQLIRVGIEIASALEVAHRQGVVHRDLKPGNIMLTKGGAKLLDFGLAKLASARVVQDEATAVMSEHKPLTQEGTIVGTFQYMAPEQLEGRDADARSDIFALGAVLYEMATGKRAFEGKTRASLIASILDRDPAPVSSVQPLTPPALEHVIAKCLEKDPDQRWQSAHDIAENLRWISEHRAEAATWKRRTAKPWIVSTAILAILAMAGGIIAFSKLRAVPPRENLELEVAMPSFLFFYGVVLSPDGSRVVFSGIQGAQRQLWIRELSSNRVRVLAGTERGNWPFWSPDGKQIGFFANGKLCRVPADGGPVQILCDAADAYGGTWNAAGTILFAGDSLGVLKRVPASGGAPQPVTKLAPKEEGHRWPFFLPDGDHFLFLGDAWRTENHHLKVGSLKTGEARDLFQGVTNVRYASGTLFYVRGLALMAQPFDLKTLNVTGDAVPVAENIVWDGINHHFDFSVSENGRMTFRSASPKSRLAWVDRNGKILQTVSDPVNIGGYDLAPDERTVAYSELDNDGRSDDLWLLDLVRGGSRRLTSDPASDYAPVWSRDGKSIAFGSNRNGIGDLYIIDDVDRGSDARLLVKLPYGGEPSSWMPNGDLVFDRGNEADFDVAILSRATGTITPYVATRFSELVGVLSPDARWIAYESSESGRSQVMLEQFPSHAGRRPVSTVGGQPHWRADSRELFFRSQKSLMSIDLTSEIATPHELFALPGDSYRPSRDGKRFLVDVPLDDVTRVPMTFVSNWQAMLDQKR